MAKRPKNMAASVRQRLLNLARSDKRDFQTVLVAFALERLIYRLSVSEYRTRFVLKGGMLVTVWTSDPGRFTRDVDFLGFGESGEADLLKVFREILSIDGNDGLKFRTESLTVSDIREDQVYGGKRLRTVANLEKTQIPVTVDIGFGDALTAPEFEIEYGSLLDFEPAKIRAYSPATVVAEKYQAVVALGLINGRMKDFYDLWAIPRATEIEPQDLRTAILTTFERRNTPVPEERPEGLSRMFANDPVKIAQWAAYSEATELGRVPLIQVLDEIWSYIGDLKFAKNS
ncbi:nucleotidyl transferase AbiEii/AbiGii toxin family protein [Henriciella aquimarina]|uniref:nucleotidyl transferase AbiEii/AbiGii toxin family protein n=1 Tax=Henriciella aquimarina TaxID=545261 RepID=UPI000A038FB9|nr:nucleotidyl transferase AbiEii/AbiGii toxin family protein [Henriciella aquimarina]